MNVPNVYLQATDDTYRYPTDSNDRPRELCTRGVGGITRAALTHESHTCHALS